MLVRLEGISKVYRMRNSTVKALDKVDLAFEGAGLVLITGENGCGKSTLLNIIGGLDKPTEGKVSVFGTDEKADLQSRAENTSYIFQTANLIDTLTVKQNIEVVADKDADVNAALQKVGISDLAGRMPYELSVGQQQRVCIARAIAKKDVILLADEPTSSLDPEMRKEIAAFLTELARDRLVIVVTHYPEDFENVDRRIVMSAGKIASDETFNAPREYAEEKNCKSKGTKALFQSTFTRTRKHAFRFIVNLLMLFVGIACIVVNESVFSFYEDDNDSWRQVLANDEALVTSDDFSALGAKVRQIYGNYLWYDFPEKIRNGYTSDYSTMQSDYYGVSFLYTPYFMDSQDIGGKKLVAGRMPQADDEVVINKYLADMYIEFYEKVDLTSYGDVIEKAVLTGFDYGLSVQQNPVFRIVGITDDDLSGFYPLKEKLSDYNTVVATADKNADDDTVSLFNEMVEWLKIGGGAVYAIDCGSSHKAVNDYFNGEVDWATAKKDQSAESGSGIINYDYGYYWLKDVKIYGDLEGAVVNFDTISPLSYKELCEKYTDPADIEREIAYVLEKNEGRKLYFSMDYVAMQKNSGGVNEIIVGRDPFKNVYYFSVELPITGVYVASSEDFSSGGLFVHGEGSVRSSVALVGEENYETLNFFYNSPPGCGLGMLDVSGLKNSKEVYEKIVTNKHVAQLEYLGQYLIEAKRSDISVVNIVALAIGAAMLLFATIFILYSVSQYFKQHSGDLGILMSLGKGKRYCGMFMLGEYLFMAAIALLLAVPTLFVVPEILNSFISGVCIKVQLFMASGMAFVYILAYFAAVFLFAVCGVATGMRRKTPIERIKERT